jgi:hypothetical protein
VDQIGDRLYELPPEQFIAARDEAVAEARRAGDRGTADAIAGFRRPTVAAWLVNLLALRRPDLLDELYALGEALRRAQHELRGEQLRELSGKRRGVVGALTAQARTLAREAGRGRLADLPLAEVETTLNAALADAGSAEAVRSGRLQKSVSYTGFGETPKPRLRVINGGGSVAAAQGAAPEPGAAAAKAAPKRSPRPSAEAELAAARTQENAAETALREATDAEHAAAGNLAELTTALDDLRRRVAAAQAAVSEAQLRRKGAERAAKLAARRVESVQQKIDRQNN